MKTAVRALLVAALACASGCAHSDWIEGTLVTVDVTGTWQSTAGGLFVLALEQQGARVKGSIQMLEMTALAHLSGPIDGTVASDTFSFRGANGSVTGKTTVSEDEMIGSVEMRATNMSIRRSINLRRVDSSARPRSQQP